jgi:hypothetical protein
MLTSESGKLVRGFLLLICGFLFMLHYDTSALGMYGSFAAFLVIVLVYLINCIIFFTYSKIKFNLILLLNHIPILSFIMILQRGDIIYISSMASVIGFIIADASFVRHRITTYRRKSLKTGGADKTNSHGSIWHTLRTVAIDN